jgi:hypothetical protein
VRRRRPRPEPGRVLGIAIENDRPDTAAREPGTVDVALDELAKREMRAQAFHDDLIFGSPDLADPDVRAQARR